MKETKLSGKIVEEESREKMKFNYCYRITYESGEVCERRRDQLCVDVSKEEYGKIITGVLAGIPIERIDGISNVITEMKIMLCLRTDG